MAIYRGPGGSGDATTDAASEATVASTKASEAQASANAAASSATSAASSATTATTQASAASTSATSAAASATTATTKASEASTSATNAATSETNAATSETNAATSATSAASSATTATTQATAAASSATSAASSATTATTKASEASTSATNAAASYDSFDDRYLGAKSSAPSVDNDGDALLTGALYWNTSSNQLFVWDGSAWDQAAFTTSASGVTSFNTRTGAVTLSASDVNTALGSPAVLDSDIGSTVQAYSSVLANTTASYTTAEETKLAGIETAATADQSAAEIKTAYESNADTNAFTDADHTKLDGIEASATADQTGAEIKTAYEAEADTNAFTDAEKTKLTGIETGATADQTGAEIKTAYEGEADTNAFTDAEKTKLTGIEASADVTDTANVTAAGALMDSEVTNLADVKSFDPADYAAASSVVGKNKIINGAMTIDQRNIGASIDTDQYYNYTVDRWVAFNNVGTGKYTIEQNAGSVTPPEGFINYVGATSSSAHTLGSTDSFNLYQRIEGLNTADLDFGKSTAKSITLSFYVRSSLTGTFGGVIANSGRSRTYPFTYTISSANTWEKKTVTIAGDTSGTWLTTNGIGVELIFQLGAGSSLLGSAGAWASANVTGATGATNLVSTSGATLYITGVQLEKGSSATSFEHRMYGTELQLCSRYFWRQYNAGQNVIYDRVYWSGSGQNALFNFPAPPGMRIVNATVTCSPTTNGSSVSFTHQQYGNIVVYRVTAAGDNFLYAGDISINAEL